MGSRTAIIAIVGVIILIMGIAAALFLLQQQQDTRSKADEGTSEIPSDIEELADFQAQQACTVPDDVTNVRIDYPHESTVKAKCSWTAVSNAENYHIKITEVDSNTLKKEEDLAAGTTEYVFDVIQDKTYRCEVTAVNACGTSVNAGSHELTCKVIGQLPTTAPTPTTAVVTGTPGPTSTPGPTATIGPTATPGPTGIAQPTTAPLPVTGNLSTPLLVGAGGALMIFVGSLLFLL